MRMEGFSQVFCCWDCPCDISSAELTGRGMEKKEKQRFSLRSKTGDLEQHGIKQEKKTPRRTMQLLFSYPVFKPSGFWCLGDGSCPWHRGQTGASARSPMAPPASPSPFSSTKQKQIVLCLLLSLP